MILTRNSAISYLTNVTVAQLTTTIREAPSQVILTPEADGTLERCVVNAYNIFNGPKDRLKDFLTELSPDRMREVKAAIEFALGFDALV